MKAAVIHFPKPIEDNPLDITDMPVPEPGPDDIPLHSDVEVYPLEEANNVLMRMKHSKIKGAAVRLPGDANDKENR